MIPVQPAPEPADFDASVRQPGLRALREGRLPELWRRALPWLREHHDRVCAYAGVRIDEVTGADSVDHFLAIQNDPERSRVYEWSNYRYACLPMNRNKGVHTDVLDPFLVQDGWFALELTAFQVVRGPRLPAEQAGLAESTITRLRLNTDALRRHRAEAFAAYEAGELSFTFLRRQLPFLASEMLRQDKVRAADLGSERAALRLG